MCTRAELVPFSSIVLSTQVPLEVLEYSTGVGTMNGYSTRSSTGILVGIHSSTVLASTAAHVL